MNTHSWASEHRPPLAQAGREDYDGSHNERKAGLQLTRSPKYKWVVAGMAFLSVFAAVGFGRNGYSAILPSMQKGLGFSGAEAGSLTSWNLAGYTVMSLVGGVFASRFGARIVITVGMMVTAAGMLFTAISDGIVSASAARLLTGMANGLVLAPAIALMSGWFRPQQLGAASGIVPAGSSVAMVVVGPVVPAIIAAGGDDGWRLAWYFFAAVTAVVCILALILLRNKPAAAPTPRRDGDAFRLGLKAVFRSGYAWYLGGIYSIQGFAISTYFTFFQKRLTADLGYSDDKAGLLFLVLGAAGIISGVIWGAFSDRLGRGRAIAAMFLLNGVSAGLFAWGPNTFALAASAFLLGSCGINVAAVIGAACADRYGLVLASAALGFVTIFTGAGQALGPYVGGYLEDVFSSLAPAYLLSAGLYVVGAVLALRLRDVPKPRDAALRPAGSEQ